MEIISPLQGRMIENDTPKDRGEPLSYIIRPLQGHEERLLGESHVLTHKAQGHKGEKEGRKDKAQGREGRREEGGKEARNKEFRLPAVT